MRKDAGFPRQSSATRHGVVKRTLEAKEGEWSLLVQNSLNSPSIQKSGGKTEGARKDAGVVKRTLEAEEGKWIKLEQEEASPEDLLIVARGARSSFAIAVDEGSLQEKGDLVDVLCSSAF